MINTIETLAKSEHLRTGNVEEATKEILKKSADILDCERVNAWLFDDDFDHLESLLAYQSKNNLFTKEDTLRSLELPNYFSFLKKGELIVSNNAELESINEELLNDYILPFGITAMIDVPLRSEGNMIGVICFEHVNKAHEWTLEEQKFTQSVAQLLSLALESNKKIRYRESLEKTIREKEVLMAELMHRVKNNMAVISSLINLQKDRTTDNFHKKLFEELKNRVFSMNSAHEQLLVENDYSEIYIDKYLNDLIKNLDGTFQNSRKVALKLELEPIKIDIIKAVPCGLIVNEVITNSYKHAFDQNNSSPSLTVRCYSIENQITIEISDNGRGIQKNTSGNNGMGLEIIDGLSSQIDGHFELTSEDGVKIKLCFPQ